MMKSPSEGAIFNGWVPQLPRNNSRIHAGACYNQKENLWKKDEIKADKAGQAMKSLRSIFKGKGSSLSTKRAASYLGRKERQKEDQSRIRVGKGGFSDEERTQEGPPLTESQA